MNIDKRRQELLEFIGNEEIFGNLIDEMVFLEVQLNELRKLPMIKVDPNNPARQKATVRSNIRNSFSSIRIL